MCGRGVARDGESAAATYPVRMARTSLTLAALATSAVADLDVIGAAPLRVEGMRTALLAARDGRLLVIRVPAGADAEAEQAAELVALAALTGGVRSRLPFAVTRVVGQRATEGTLAVVVEQVAGMPSPVATMGYETASSVGAAIAAIHSLPTGCVTEVGLPSLGPVHAHQTASAVLERALHTGVLPALLKERWERALADDALWQFQPTVVHGSLGADTVLSDGVEVTGIVGWHGLRVADPALDLAWLFSGRGSETGETAYATYLHARPGADRTIVARATLYSELEIAKWLLHGTDTRSGSIVDDAVALLHGLVDDVHDRVSPSLGQETAPILAVADVERLLDRVEKVG